MLARRKRFGLYRLGDVLPSARQAQVWKESSRRDHLTGKQLFQIIKRTDYKIGLNYVYYIMWQLRCAGWVTARKYKSETYYDKAIHSTSSELLMCRVCGRVQPALILSYKVIQKIARTYGFRIKMYTLEIRGACKRCNNVQSFNSRPGR